MLRNFDESTEFGKKVKKVKAHMDRGELVTDEIMVELVSNRIAMADCARGFILDGFPRNLNQAKALDEIMVKAGKPLDVVLAILVDDEHIKRRIAERLTNEKRGDDNPEAVDKRLKTYRALTEPVIAYYQQKGKLAAVDGSKEIGQVTSAINGKLSLVNS
jgi:adenylate kinase